MFTGIVEATGKVKDFSSTQERNRLVIAQEAIGKEAKVGDSIAVNGCCLTVTDNQKGFLSFDLLKETINLTNFHEIKAESHVNLEQSMPLNGRLGGHFVTGHIDCIGKIKSFEKKGSDYALWIEFPPAHNIHVVPKGSIAIDGISLTVAEVKDGSCLVWIIPHTYEVTCLRERHPGSGVNLEFDLLGKYVEKILVTQGHLR